MTTQLDIALTQLAMHERDAVGGNEMKGDPRILLGQAIDDGRHESCRHGLGAPEPQLPSVRIGQELELPDALAQLVEHGDAALRSARP